MVEDEAVKVVFEGHVGGESSLILNSNLMFSPSHSNSGFVFRLSNHFFPFFSSAPRSVNELYVDDPDKDSGGKIEVSLNISLPNLHCDCEYI